mmetsp:Transcript_2769/g.3986  ORF Transcript_2769/g.3986 Transcript_2769/m.3986 type:complete len:92 (+) Transcript_2769:113-388(+)|eukprot:CAMPEP_0117426082 /NCGR_PEP_ID=MMETSP0758-20121206/6251_1 /TAXON_ID=63605 /ORGANISM="Percolomonas cosmopolitus, Strain AE-1 (ATCC 50343)" /LENGTH=91 /DNA_ID=CAMNT_0005211005 /DNA_START=114 /DNA_END=389 /DNA_ORIENTATION=-
MAVVERKPGMINNDNELVDIYIPRKCTATNKLIGAKDHASVQIQIGYVDENGVYTGENSIVNLSGKVRSNSQADDALNRHCIETIKIMKDI